MIRKLPSGGYRLYSRKKDPKTDKRRNLGTFKTRAAAEKHERATSTSSGAVRDRISPIAGAPLVAVRRVELLRAIPHTQKT
jgi:hypothetical protein